MEFLTPVKITWGFYKKAEQGQLISYKEEKDVYQVIIPINNLIVEIKSENIREFTEEEKQEQIKKAMEAEKKRQEKEAAQQQVDSIVKSANNSIIWSK